MPRYRFDDDDVVVIVGSGAGGGTLANELCQKGIKVVVLEAGPHHTPEDYVNDEWRCVHADGLAGQPHDVGLVPRRARLPQPARLDVQGRRRHDDALGGRCPRFMEHEFKASTYYGEIDGANLLDWPISLADLEPYYDQAEIKHRHHAPTRHPAAAGQQQLQGVRQRRRAASATSASPPAATPTNAEPYDGRPASLQDGFNFQGDKNGSKWSTLVARAAQGAGHRQARPAARVARRSRSRTTRTASPRASTYLDGDGLEQFQRARLVCVAGNSIETAAAAAELGLEPAPGRPGELVGPGRPQLHAAHDRLGLRASSTSRCGCTAARRWPASSPTRPATTPSRGFVGGYYLETLSLGRAVPGGVRRPGRVGPGLHRGDGRLREHRRPVDRRRGHAAGDQPRHAQHGRDRPARPAGAERPLRRPPERRRHARARLGGRRGAVRVGRRGADDPHAAVPGDAQPRHLRG